MRTLIVAAFLFALRPAAQAAEGSCVFDQEAQLRVLHNLAKAHPGGRLDRAARKITWSLSSKVRVTFEYGGCAHLGSAVTRSERRAVPHAEQRALTLARSLAMTYWQAAEAGRLKERLARKDYQTRSEPGGTRYDIRDENYDSFFVSHTYTKGEDRVVIGWMGRF